MWIPGQVSKRRSGSRFHLVNLHIRWVYEMMRETTELWSREFTLGRPKWEGHEAASRSEWCLQQVTPWNCKEETASLAGSLGDFSSGVGPDLSTDAPAGWVPVMGQSPAKLKGDTWVPTLSLRHSDGKVHETSIQLNCHLKLMYDHVSPWEYPCLSRGKPVLVDSVIIKARRWLDSDEGWCSHPLSLHLSEAPLQSSLNFTSSTFLLHFLCIAMHLAFQLSAWYCGGIIF